MLQAGQKTERIEVRITAEMKTLLQSAVQLINKNVAPVSDETLTLQNLCIVTPKN